ncbi:MAG: DUF72 domain-containing protein [Nitrospira sp.]|nr:DUF72 domain-containing protein [Nitrospira sp.]
MGQAEFAGGRSTCPTRASAHLKTFLRALPAGRRYNIEFRDQSWQTGRVFDFLRQYNVAFCIYELGGIRSALEVTADFVYVRLHGPGNKYEGDYSITTLKSWATRLERWIKSHRGVYVYFDNDQAGYAVKHAQELKNLIACEAKE